MKTLETMILCVLVQLSICMQSCSDQDFNTEMKKPNSETQEKVKIKAFGSSTLSTTSESNPDLYSDWDNIRKIYLNGGLTIDAPWIMQSGNTMNIPDYIRIDIKKENGWIMLGHSMTKRTSSDPNYMVFYHKKSGILKGFYLTTTPSDEYFIWTLESDKPSSIIPTNTRESKLINDPVQYSGTSNILKSSIVNSESILRYGWNCFTFELPYGQIHTSPIIHINGYSISRTSTLTYEAFSKEIVIPSISKTNSLEPWTEYWEKVDNLNSGIATFNNLVKFPQNTIIPKSKSTPPELISIMKPAISVVSSLLGGASSYVSTNKTVTSRYKLAGNRELNSSMINDIDPSLTTSVRNVDIKALNNNEELGVWGLKESPKIRLDKYGAALSQAPRTRSKSNDYTRIVNLSPTIKKESVIINPKLLPLIKDYSVSTKYIFSTKEERDQLKLIPSIPYNQISDHWYAVEIPSPRMEITKRLNSDNFYLPPGKKEHIFYFECMDRFPETYIDITVTIEYNDGEIFSSGRVFKIDGTVYDNKQDILNSLSKTSLEPIFL